MTKLNAVLSASLLTLALGRAYAQPTVSGNVAGGDKQSADTTRPDIGAPDAAGQAKVWHDQDTRSNNTVKDRKAQRQAERNRRSAMSSSPSYNSSTPSTDTSAAPGAPGNSGAPNSRSSAGATGGGKP